MNIPGEKQKIETILISPDVQFSKDFKADIINILKEQKKGIVKN